MGLLPLIAWSGLSLAAWSQEAGLAIEVAGHRMQAAAIEAPRGQEDVKDLESFVLVNMSRRGVCMSKLGRGFYERLHGVLGKAAQEEPTKFHYFVAMSPQFDERQISEIFVVLRDAPEGFPAYVAHQVRFFAPARASEAGQDGASPALGEAAPPALREAQVSEVAIREYQRYLMHCGLFCPGMGMVGTPEGNEVDLDGSRRPYDLDGMLDGSAWDSAKSGSSHAPPVFAGAQDR